MTYRTCLIGWFLILSIAVSASNGADEATLELPEKSKFHLFLLVGQSNMAGRGRVAAADEKSHPRVWMLTKANQWKLAIDPLHFDKPQAGVGLGKTFALDVVQRDPTVTVGLIPCAAGGSPISSWEPGGYHKQTNSHPYDDAIRRAKLAMRSGTLKAILWHQGESDSKAGRAETYERNLHALVARFRADLAVSKVPFVVGQLGQFPERPWNEFRKKVDAAHRSLPAKIANTAFVSSDGLRHKGDEVHFNASSYREFGHRYAEAYRRLIERAPRASDQ